MHKELWEYLNDLKNSGSLNLTSQKYNISAQAMGKAIRRLENEIGFPLLIRSYTGVTLTPQGKQALERANLFFHSLQEIKESYEHINKSLEQEYKIELNTVSMVALSYPLMSQYRETFPNCNIIEKERTLLEAFSLLDDKTIDYFICTLIYEKNKLISGHKNIAEKYNFFPFYLKRFFALVHRKHPLAKYKTVSLNTILKYPFAVYSPMHSIEVSIFTALCSAGYTLPKDYIVESEKERYDLALTLGKYIGMGDNDSNNYTDYFKSQICFIPISNNITYKVGYLLRKEDTIQQYPLVLKHLNSINSNF